MLKPLVRAGRLLIITPIDLRRLSPRDTTAQIEQRDFVDQVRQLAAQLLERAGSPEHLESMLASTERVIVDQIALDLPVLHRAALLRDVVLLAAAIRCLGTAALQMKVSQSQIEVWELAACQGDESTAQLCERALSRAGTLDEVTNSHGETFELVLRTTHPDLGAQLFGNYWTSHGSGAGQTCTEHPIAGWSGGPWKRSELPTLTSAQWLAFRCQHIACTRLNPIESGLDLCRHMGQLLKDLIDGCRSASGWHSRALVVGRCSERLAGCPDIGDGVFAGCSIPAGTFLGVTAGRFAEHRPGREEFEYFWDIHQGSIAPRKLGGIMARCQTSFPNLLDLGVPLPCGLVMQAFVAMDEISAGEMLVIDYGYNHHTKLNTYTELRPEALTAFIEEISGMELESLTRLLLENGGIALSEMNVRTAGRIVPAETLAERRLLTQLLYVLGTPSALVEFFWKNPELAAGLEQFFCSEMPDAGWLPEGRLRILSRPGSELRNWVCSLSAGERSVLSDTLRTAPSRYSGACLMNFLNLLGQPETSGLRKALGSYAAWCLLTKSATSDPVVRKVLDVIDREMQKLEDIRLSHLATLAKTRLDPS